MGLYYHICWLMKRLGLFGLHDDYFFATFRILLKKLGILFPIHPLLQFASRAGDALYLTLIFIICFLHIIAKSLLGISLSLIIMVFDSHMFFGILFLLVILVFFRNYFFLPLINNLYLLVHLSGTTILFDLHLHLLNFPLKLILRYLIKVIFR